MRKMNDYKVNEIFYSLQGEGYYTGTAALFIRFSGCNLRCPFCDTEFESHVIISEDDLVEEVKKAPCKLVVLTGGEPTLQLTKSLCDKIHALGKIISIETNGSHEIPDGWIDYITCSPKDKFVKEIIRLKKADEIKVVVDKDSTIDDIYHKEIECNRYYIQPCDEYDVEKNRQNIERAVYLILKNPDIKMSLQTQKYINVR